MKIYTRTGDDGSTGLYGGDRVQKHDAHVEAYGAVDETNANLGAVRALAPVEAIGSKLAQIQADLFVLGAELACPPARQHKLGIDLLGASDVQRLETWIDEFEADLPPLKSFVLPGGNQAAAELHRARTVCRRAERRVVALGQAAPVRAEALGYLNRLGDLMFSMARAENHARGQVDEPWLPR